MVKSYYKSKKKISFFKKKKNVTAAAVTENGPWTKEKTNSFRNTKFGIQIAFSMKMCKMPSSKIRDQVLYRLLSKFGTTFRWNTAVR